MDAGNITVLAWQNETGVKGEENGDILDHKVIIPYAAGG